MNLAEEWDAIPTKGAKSPSPAVFPVESNSDRIAAEGRRLVLLKKELQANPNDPALAREIQRSQGMVGAAPLADEWDSIDTKSPAPKSQETDKPASPAKGLIDTSIRDVGRQVGLTARAGLNAVGSTVGMLTDPIAGLLQSATGAPVAKAGDYTNWIADHLGLPSPQNSTERIAGAVASGMASGGIISGAARGLANAAKGTTSAVIKDIAGTPAQAVLSGGGASAGGQVAAENGVGPAGQAAAAIAGGIAAPVAGSLAVRGAGALIKGAKDAISAERNIWGADGGLRPSAEAQKQVTNALQASGINVDDIPTRALAQIAADADVAIKAGKPINPDEVARVARAAKFNTKLTAGQITQDPALVQSEFNNEGIGQAGKTIRDFKTTNERNFLSTIDDRISSYKPQSTNAYEASERTIGTLQRINAGLKESTDDAYKAARAAVGGEAPVPMQPIASTLGQISEERGIDQLGGAVKSFLADKGLLNKDGTLATTQRQTFTVKDADLLRKIINRNPPDAANPGAVRTIAQLRDAINSAEGLLADKGDEIGSQAAQLYKQARAQHAAHMALKERVPALADAEGLAPDKFVQKYITGNNATATAKNVSDLMQLLEGAGQTQAVGEIRAELGRVLRSKIQPNAVNQKEAAFAGQEAGKWINNSLGQQKLDAIMGPEAQFWREAAQVASDLTFIPKRTHAQVSGNYAAIGSLLEKIASKEGSTAANVVGMIPKYGTGLKVGMELAGASARAQSKNAQRLVDLVTSGRIPVESVPVRAGEVARSSVPIGALLGSKFLPVSQPGREDQRNK